jgi:hypothetical protein
VHEDVQQRPAYALLHRSDGVRIEPAPGMEDDLARGGVEHAVNDHTAEVQVGITVRALRARRLAATRRSGNLTADVA